MAQKEDAQKKGGDPRNASSYEAALAMWEAKKRDGDSFVSAMNRPELQRGVAWHGFSTGVDFESAQKLANHIDWAIAQKGTKNAVDIFVVRWFSPGGSVLAGFLMFEAFRRLRMAGITYVAEVVWAASMAAQSASCADYLYLFHDGILMYHDLRSTLYKELTPRSLGDLVADYAAFSMVLNALPSERIAQRRTFQNLPANDNLHEDGEYSLHHVLHNHRKFLDVNEQRHPHSAGEMYVASKYTDLMGFLGVKSPKRDYYNAVYVGYSEDRSDLECGEVISVNWEKRANENKRKVERITKNNGKNNGKDNGNGGNGNGGNGGSGAGDGRSKHAEATALPKGAICANSGKDAIVAEEGEVFIAGRML